MGIKFLNSCHETLRIYCTLALLLTLSMTGKNMSTLIALLIALNGLFCVSISPANAQDICKSGSDCAFGTVCCRGKSKSSTRDYATKRCLGHVNTTAANSCYGHFCRTDMDCEGPKDGKVLCCEDGVCSVCPKCDKNADCGWFMYCCKGFGQCRAACLNHSCNTNLDCGNDLYCCRSSVCVKCSDAGCGSHSQCGARQYCCGRKSLQARDRNCKGDCIGEYCSTKDDCARPGECCEANKCVRCAQCNENEDCVPGTRCCGGEHACKRSCLGSSCFFESDCDALDECCMDNVCSKCGDLCGFNSDCLNGTYCCHPDQYAFGKCSLSCEGKMCRSNRDCGDPHTICVQNMCAEKCESSADCARNDGGRHHCCYRGDDLRICMTAPCLSKSTSSAALPSWLASIIICAALLLLVLLGSTLVFCWRFKKRARLRMANVERRGENENAESLLSRARYSPTRLRVRLEEPRGNTYHAPPVRGRGVEIPLQVLNPENEHSSVPPPSYSPGVPFVSTGNEMCTTNNRDAPIPPPPFSFDERPVPIGLNDDLPPTYDA